MKTFAITVVCLIGLCTTAFSQTKTNDTNNPVKGSGLFPVKVMDITNPKTVVLQYANKEKVVMRTESDDLTKLCHPYLIITPVSYYTAEKKFNIIN